MVFSLEGLEGSYTLEVTERKEKKSQMLQMMEEVKRTLSEEAGPLQLKHRLLEIGGHLLESHHLLLPRSPSKNSA